VLRTFAERVIEQMSDTPPPNCGLCGYRAQVLSLEDGGEHVITAAERAHPAFGAVPPPTCVLCKYRTKVLGFEAEVGAVQESHHHHVEGQGASAPGSNVADCSLCDTFCTGLCRLEALAAQSKGHGHSHAHGHHHSHGHAHDHGHGQDHGHDHHHGSDHSHAHGHYHHHAVYPHAHHPHGPESARKTAKPAE
jgi:sirohydrochlorin cobaltochelatase